MRNTAREDVAITTVVVRRPVGPDSGEENHRLLARAMLDSLSSHGTASMDRLPTGRPTGRSRYAGTGGFDWTRAILLSLSALCLIGAGFMLHLAVK